ncbi:ATP-binding cassette domain-containing protein [Corynebacterium sp. HMSC072B09]|uniref:ATP-binding cassette domain-containing protein n=1 Tax=Corynebacterium sp. HMSC072B09 TaxID=1739489 RepID=UPI003527AF30
MVGVKGPSGSGKSTLLRCLIGLNHAESGEIECAGVTREAKRTWPRKNRLMMQIVPQDPASTLNPKNDRARCRSACSPGVGKGTP